jgi:hypothetical protein
MEDLFNLFEKPKNPLSFNAIKISIDRPNISASMDESCA